MKNKIINNTILILIILGMLGLAMFVLFLATDEPTYAAINVNNQNNLTNNDNVTFDVGFAEAGSRVITSHSVVADVNPEYRPIYIDIGLNEGCTLNDVKVQFFDSSNGSNLNWDLGFGSVTSEYVISSSATAKTINFVPLVNTTGLNFMCVVFPNFSERVEVSKLNETTKAVFTATCIDSNGYSSPVYKEIYFNIGWTGTFTMDLTQYLDTYIRNSDKTLTISTLLSNKLNTNGKYNSLPVKQTQLIVDVPTYKGIAPTSVEVKAKKTVATNGQNESNLTFNSSNYNWNPGTGKLTITVTNEPDASGKVACYRGIDEYIIKYIYPQAAYDAFTQEASITSKVTGTMTLYSNTSTINVPASIDKTINMEREIGIEETAISKVPLYINAESDEKLAIKWGRLVTVYAEEASEIASFRMEFGQLKFKIGNTDKDSYISGRNYAPLSKFYVTKDSFNEVLGSSGCIKVYDEKFNLVGTINSSSTLNARNQYEFSIPEDYQKSAEKFILETSKPRNVLSQLYVSCDRDISPDLPFTIEQLHNLKSTAALFRIYEALDSNPTNFVLNPESNLIINNMEFIDTYTDATLNVLTSTLDASNSDYQELKLNIVLNDIEDYDDLWKTPYFDIELPSYITDIKELCRFDVNYRGYIMPDSSVGAHIFNLGNKMHFAFACTGVQPYHTSPPTTITLTLQVKVDKYASNLSQEAKLYYINDTAREYKNPASWMATPASTGETVGFPIMANGTQCGVSTAEVNFVTGANLLCISELSGYNGSNKINSLDNKDATDQIAIAAVDPTMTLTVQNNHTVPTSGLSILGRIPYTGNKYVISNVDLGTNINTTLKNKLTKISGNINNYTIYYSDNINATKDLTDPQNNWTTSPASLSTIKSYLIVIGDTLDVGEQVKFQYNFSIPAGVNYNNTLFTNFGAYYTANGVENTSESAKIGLTTGTGPILTAEKTSSIVAGRTVKEGDIITYTINVRNTGTVAANNVVITDNIPANTVYVVSDGAGGYTKVPETRTITENIGTVAASGNYVYSFSVMVEEISANTTISNTANITADGVPSTPSTTSTISAVTSAPNLTLTKTSSIPSGTSVKEGDQITYTIIVRNDGDGIAKNVVIHDAIPKNTTYINGTTGNKEPERIKIDSETKETLAPGETYQFQFTVVVDPIRENTTIENAATVTYDNGDTKTSNTVEIPATASAPILQVIKTSSIGEGKKVKEGDLITYTITVNNIGYGPAKNTIIKDTVPAGTVYYDKATNTEKPEIKDISETRATLNPGESFSVSFTVKVGRVSTATKIKNTAKVEGDNITDTPSNTLEINADITVPNLRAVKTSSIEEGKVVKEGDLITYTITVYNDGTTPAYNVTINDKVPEHTTYYENNERKPDKVNIGYPIPVLNPGENRTYSFTVIVDEIPENGSIQNTASVSAENSPEIPTNPIEIDSQISVPELKAEKTSSVEEGKTVKSGDIITYTITVTNTGDCNAHNVIISDNIPENTTYVEQVGSKYISDKTRKNISKTIETLKPGESADLTFSVMVNQLEGNVKISNTAKVDANNGETTPSNSVEISAKPKDNPSDIELPYAGNYSLIIIGVIAVVCVTGFAIYEYKRLKNNK